MNDSIYYSLHFMQNRHLFFATCTHYRISIYYNTLILSCVENYLDSLHNFGLLAYQMQFHIFCPTCNEDSTQHIFLKFALIRNICKFHSEVFHGTRRCSKKLAQECTSAPPGISYWQPVSLPFVGSCTLSYVISEVVINFSKLFSSLLTVFNIYWC